MFNLAFHCQGADRTILNSLLNLPTGRVSVILFLWLLYGCPVYPLLVCEEGYSEPPAVTWVSKLTCCTVELCLFVWWPEILEKRPEFEIQ